MAVQGSPLLARPIDAPSLPGGWCYKPLASLVDNRGISYGVVQPGSAVSDGVPILRVNNIRGGKIITNDVLCIDRGIEAKHQRTRLRGGEVLLTLVGSLGECAVVPGELAGWNVARAVGVIPVKQDIEPDWVAYCLRSPLPQRYVHEWATTTVQATLNLRDVGCLPIPVPPRGVREKILQILGSLDKKATVARRTSKTLDAMARAIFKSWFVDTEVSSREALGDLVVLHREALEPSASPGEWFNHYSIPAFDENRRPVIELGGNIKSNKFLVPEGAILLSKLNPRIPRIWRPRIDKEPRSISSTEFLVFTPRQQRDDRDFLYSLFCSEEFMGTFASRATGTSGSHQRVRPEDLLAMHCLVPDTQVRRRYSRVVGPLFERIDANLEESRTLAALRDALLPKLLSGEIRVKQAEKIVGEVA